MNEDMTMEEYLNQLLTSDTNEHCPVRKTLELLKSVIEENKFKINFKEED